MPNDHIGNTDRYVGTDATVTSVKVGAWSFEDHRRLEGSVSSGSSGCVFPFMYSSQARVTCVFNDSSLYDDDNNDAKDVMWCGTAWTKDYDTDKNWTTCDVAGAEQRRITCDAKKCKPAPLVNCIRPRLNSD